MPRALSRLLGDLPLPPKAPTAGWLKLITALVVSFTALKLLQQLAYVITPKQMYGDALSGVLVLLILHTLVLIALRWWLASDYLRRRPYFPQLKECPAARRNKWGLVVVLLYAGSVVGLGVGVYLFQGKPSSSVMAPLSTWLVMVFWVPVVEELLFRGYLTSWLYGISGHHFRVICGSAVVFALLHGSSPWAPFPLGPLVLALFCELLRSGALPWWAPIGVHAVANGSVYIWSYFAPELLQQLSLWYLSYE